METNTQPSPQPGATTNETARVEAFSDGVFAIAITLLVLELHIPADVRDGQLASELLKLWPSYLAFLASFVTIGVIWMNHHRLFGMIRRADQRLLVINGLLLLGVSITPFPTAVIAKFIGRPDERLAAMLYNGLFVLLTLFFNMLWLHTRWANLADEPAAEKLSHRQILMQFSFGPLMYLLAVIVAYFSAWPSMVLNIALALLYAIPTDRVALFERMRRRLGHGPRA